METKKKDGLRIYDCQARCRGCNTQCEFRVHAKEESDIIRRWETYAPYYCPYCPEEHDDERVLTSSTNFPDWDYVGIVEAMEGSKDYPVKFFED
jgi:hypothetical protein